MTTRFQTGHEVVEEIERVALAGAWSLSPASVARYVGELFGQRPEPWLEMQVRNNPTAQVTVTAVPAEETDELERGGMDELERVPFLSALTPQPRASQPRAPTPATTTARSGIPTEIRKVLRRWPVALGVSAALAVGLAITIAVVPSRSTAGGRAAKPVDVPRLPAVLAPVDAAASLPPEIDLDPPEKPAKPHHAAPADDVVALYNAGRYADAVVACAVSGKQLAQSPATCTMAACKSGDSASARRWLLDVPAGKRDGLRAACQAAGAPLDEPPAKAGR